MFKVFEWWCFEVCPVCSATWLSDALKLDFYVESKGLEVPKWAGYFSQALIARYKP